MSVDEPPDTESGQDHVDGNPLRAPERHFHAEETVLAFKADLALRAVEVRTGMLLHEVIGLPVCREVDGMALLLDVVPEVEAAGGVPESFAADNKEDVHGFLPVALS
jgi:hypothetical protein